MNHFPIEELIESLMTYEMTCKAHNKHKNNLPKNKKDLTLRTQEDHSSESSSDDNFELLAIKLKKLMKQESKNKNKLKKNTTTCYERKKSGYYKDSI